MSFSFGHASCELALRCVSAPNLRTCLALRWGAQRADMRTCLVFALRTCVRAPNLRTCLALRWGAQLATCLALRWGAQPCEALLKGLPPSQNLFLSILQLVFYPSAPCADVFVADEFCVWATILRACLALRWGAQLADVPCVALWTYLVLRLGTHIADVPSIALGCPNLVRPY
jgi:hypothetical protein